MSAAVKYQLEAYSSKYSDLYRVDILEEGYTGAIRRKYIGAGHIRLNKSDGVIQSTVLNINLKSDSNFEYLGFFQYDNRKYPVKLYKNDVHIWSGYITAESYQEPYINPPYDVDISATDGLGLLESYLFPEIDGNISRLEALKTCLSYTGLTAGFSIALDLFSEGMDTDRAMLEQLYFLAEIFAGETCSKVIESLLPYGCIITFSETQNRWLIRRPFEDAEKTHLLYNAAAEYTGTATGETLLQMGALSKAGIWPHGQPLLTMQHAIKSAEIVKEYGKKQSFLKNYNFSNNLVNWINYTEADILFAENDNKTFVVIKSPTTTPDTHFIRQTIPLVLKTNSDFYLKVKFDAIAKNQATTLAALTGTSRTVKFRLYISWDDVTYYLGVSGWQTTACFIEMDIISSPGFPSWKDLEIICGNIPVTGMLTIDLFRIEVEGGGSPRNSGKQGDATFTDVFIFTAELEEINPTQTILLTVKDYAAGETEKITLKPVDLPDVDNAPLYFQNGNYTKSGDDYIPTRLWSNSEGDLISFESVIMDQIINYFSNPRQTISGCEWRGAGLHLNAVAVHPYNYNRVFVATAGTWNILEDTFNITWIEKPGNTEVTLNEWILKDGMWGDSGRIWIDEDTWKDANTNLLTIEIENAIPGQKVSLNTLMTLAAGDVVKSLPFGDENLFGDHLYHGATRITAVPYELPSNDLRFEVSLFANQTYQTDIEMTINGVDKTVQFIIIL